VENIKIPLKLAEELLAAIISNRLKEKSMSDVESDTQDYQIVELNDLEEYLTDSNNKLKEFQLNMKDLITQDLLKALVELRKIVDESSDTFNTIILITARYNRINKYFHKNLIDFQAVETEMAKIENAVLFLVDNLDKSILNKL
jgi:hypothetical protein